ncbi:dTDP-glucose 4,6-dehydratase [Bacillus pseudomycoides]|uniref:dTDP-glucose 4,6-dehydratase n=1 Tax=Bacillus pseudomycoides TaxID=64104 RepID=A0AAJ1YUX6_9BACI|nr:dTDP-glucose 4,6-dehydratase [Bacillus pseudomycoides]KFN13107.1 dTDP-glucose 4,6-dehydratase [Bacillus pseudomycoides]MDR4190223.1 dTDP-glucose 4,6-dehydratase [Bacillus pseudomycoides]MDR4324974.1 dTDP-glucose 4,6-dehydratase [Bacillus pseudomycoides]MED0857168.1 dTDP-glucose 4,6-dehydratase [Bacillus pseudomycoides]MED1538268.1 dTDP-glucose 4,6-dehydratase [Bacillus pseudomycoides]
MNVLVTGGAGFIGSNFVRYFLKKYPDFHVINYDLLTYAGNLSSIKDIEPLSNYTFIQGDIRDAKKIQAVMQDYKIDSIVHFAAESHVDRSIQGPMEFYTTNIVGTAVLLEAAKTFGIQRFLHISTDEVYGSLGETGHFTEETPISPNSPYSSSKASSDLIALSYFETYKLPVIVTRCSNNYGPYQYPEKLIPLMITNAMGDKELPVYGTGQNVRDWLHVFDHCTAIDLVLHNGKDGEIYNVGGNNEKRNVEIVEMILEKLGKSKSMISFVPDRLGHDWRYAIDSSKLQRELGWKPVYSFTEGLEDTIEWYKENEQWWKPLKSR